MKKLNDQLKTISKSLASLSKQVDKISTQVAKLDTAKKKAATKKKAPAGRAAKKVVRKTAVGKKPATVLDTVFEVIARAKKGVSIDTLKQKTNLDPRQLSNALYKLSKRAKIQSVSRGVYAKK